MNKLINIIVAIVALSIFGCSVKSTTDLTYSITCVQLGVDSDTTYSKNVVGYGFYGDTSLYAPASFYQANSGKLSLRQDTTKSIESDFVATFASDSGLIRFSNLTREGKIVLVVCDRENSIYSYRAFEVVTDLDEITTELAFQVNTFAIAPDTSLIINSWIQKR